MKAEVQAIRGHLNMLLLAVLQHGALHGYAVREALRRGSNGRFDLSEGSVYPALHRLEHLGLIASAWSVVERRHLRTYQLTPAGRDKLAADRCDWQDFADAVAALLGPEPPSASPESAQATP